MIDLKFSGFDREGRPTFFFQKVTYKFDVPEPMSYYFWEKDWRHWV